jgi:hypothetical protein
MPRAKKSANGDAKHSNPEAIARRAYEIYLGRGGYDGADLDDWLEAERQLKPGTGAVTGLKAEKPKRRKPSPRTGA